MSAVWKTAEGAVSEKMSQDLFSDFDNPDDPDAVSNTPVEFSEASGSAESQRSQEPQPGADPQQTTYPCYFCKSILKTFRGFRTHVASHKVKDLNKRKPKAVSFVSRMPRLASEILDELKQEPTYGNATKRLFLDELSTQLLHAEWKDLFEAVSDPILVLLCEKSKVLPLNQYEQCLMNVNHFLNDSMPSLVEKLTACCDHHIDSELAGRIVFRIASKLLEKLQTIIAKDIQETEQSDRLEETLMMSESEMKAFEESIGAQLRNIVKTSLARCSSSVHAQSLCVREKFVCCQQLVSTDYFLEKKYWFSGDENSIVISDKVIQFCLAVERVVRNFSSKEKIITEHEVFEEVLKMSDVLDSWYLLTNAHLNEDDSLKFMKSFIQYFVKRSSHKEVLKKNRLEEKQIKATEAALRTHLHRNYTPSTSGK